MSEETADQLRQGIDELQNKVNSLRSAVQLGDLSERFAELGRVIESLPARVTILRTRDYHFAEELAQKVAGLQQRRAGINQEVLNQIVRHASLLEWELRPIDGQLNDLRSKADIAEEAQPLLDQASNAVNTLEGNLEAATDSIVSMFEPLETETQDLARDLDRIEWTFDQLSEASFNLQSGELMVMGVKAKWDREGKDDPEGVLYLTNQRVLFEQKQEIALKKVLFITTKKEKVQRLLLELPVGQIAKTEPMKKGLLGHEDHLEVTFQPGVNPSLVHFHIDGQDCKTWPALIDRARSI